MFSVYDGQCRREKPSREGSQIFTQSDTLEPTPVREEGGKHWAIRGKDFPGGGNSRCKDQGEVMCVCGGAGSGDEANQVGPCGTRRQASSLFFLVNS